MIGALCVTKTAGSRSCCSAATRCGNSTLRRDMTTMALHISRRFGCLCTRQIGLINKGLAAVAWWEC